MPISGPSNLTVSTDGSTVNLSWTLPVPPMGDVNEVWKQATPGLGWSLVHEAGPSDTSWADTTIYDNAVHTYKVRARRDDPPPTEYSDFTSEAYVGIYNDTISNTVNVSSVTPGEVLGIVETVTNTVNATSSVAEILGIVETITNTVNVSSVMGEASSIKTDYGWYWGTTDGYVHAYSDSYMSDNGTSVLSLWRSKTVDFSELNLKFAGVYKTVYRVSVEYVDVSSQTPILVSISTDGGATWTSSSTVSVGNGTLGTATKDFWFIGVCGRYFDFKVEYPSTNKTFQLIGLRIDFEPWGEAIT